MRRPAGLEGHGLIDGGRPEAAPLRIAASIAEPAFDNTDVDVLLISHARLDRVGDHPPNLWSR